MSGDCTGTHEQVNKYIKISFIFLLSTQYVCVCGVWYGTGNCKL